jgi:hypothetical protein
MGKEKVSYVFIFKKTKGEPEKIVSELIDEIVKKLLLLHGVENYSDDTKLFLDKGT